MLTFAIFSTTKFTNIIYYCFAMSFLNDAACSYWNGTVGTRQTNKSPPAREIASCAMVAGSCETKNKTSSEMLDNFAHMCYETNQ